MSCFSKEDYIYMRRCLQLARCGSGSTSPNPMVGTVIVHEGHIIGEGYHIRAGEPHAEVNAVSSVKECDKPQLPHSTVYVTLEPCSHYGKTPPCCDMLISRQVKRVVIGITDSNVMVNGSGISRMRDAGIEVCTGLLEEECHRLNRDFFAYHNLSRPAITLKWAQSADGYIDTIREGGKATAISTPVSRIAVHKLRSMHDAILVGTRTALLDNPSLDVRDWYGRSPIRLVIDRNGRLPETLNIFDGSQQTFIYTEKATPGKFGKNTEQIELDFSKDVLKGILSHLHSIKVNSLLVEGGSRLLQSFIDSSLWDDIRIETNPSLFLGDGVPAPVVPPCTDKRKTKCGKNEILHLKR